MRHTCGFLKSAFEAWKLIGQTQHSDVVFAIFKTDKQLLDL